MFKSPEENTQVILVSNQMSKKALNESTHFMSNPDILSSCTHFYAERCTYYNIGFQFGGYV